MILQGIGIGLSILGGLGKASAAEDITNAKKKQLRMKADYNKKQVDESLEDNYVKLMANYAQNRGQLAMDRSKADNAIRVMSTQGGGAIDVTESSVFANSNAQADNEYKQSLASLDDWKFNQRVNMETQAINKKLNIDLGVIDTESQLDIQQQNAEQSGFAQALSGVLSGFELFQENRANAQAQEKFQSSISNYTNNVLSGNEYYKDFSSSMTPRLSTGQEAIRNFGLTK